MKFLFWCVSIPIILLNLPIIFIRKIVELIIKIYRLQCLGIDIKFKHFTLKIRAYEPFDKVYEKLLKKYYRF